MQDDKNLTEIDINNQVIIDNKKRFNRKVDDFWKRSKRRNYFTSI